LHRLRSGCQKADAGNGFELAAREIGQSMSKTQDRRAAYNSVIQDLYAKRARLDQAIEALEALLRSEGAVGELPDGAEGAAPMAGDKRIAAAPPDEPDDASGSLISAIKSVLRRSDRPMGNAEIFKQLKLAGVQFRSANPQLSVSQVLSRNSRLFGEPVRMGRGHWALR
jgi:hypothetical protein